MSSAIPTGQVLTFPVCKSRPKPIWVVVQILMIVRRAASLSMADVDCSEIDCPTAFAGDGQPHHLHLAPPSAHALDRLVHKPIADEIGQELEREPMRRHGSLGTALRRGGK